MAGACRSQSQKLPTLTAATALPHCTMQSSLQEARCALTCLLLLLLLSGVEPRPPTGEENRLQLETVQRGILDRLGLQEPPVLGQRQDQEGVRQAHQLYRETLAQLQANWSRGESQAPAPVRSVHLLTPTLQQQPEAPAGRARYHLVLSRTEAFHQELSVVRAELRLFKQVLGTRDGPRLNASWLAQVEVYQLPAPGQHQGHPKLLHSQTLNATAWTLDLGAAVWQWAASAESRLHLELVFAADLSAFLATRRSRQGAETLELEVESRARAGPRRRRARALEEECRKSERKCCLRSLKVSFQDIGWSDWVVAPNSYDMKFCQGSCPHNYKPASMHAQIKARMHSLSKEAPAPCCVPAGYDPMVLLHYTSEGRLVSTLFEDMLVTGCHCA